MERRNQLLTKFLTGGAYDCMSRSVGPISSFCWVELLFGAGIDRLVDSSIEVSLLI